MCNASGALEPPGSKPDWLIFAELWLRQVRQTPPFNPREVMRKSPASCLNTPNAPTRHWATQGSGGVKRQLRTFRQTAEACFCCKDRGVSVPSPLSGPWGGF